MNRASPVELRKALEAAHLMAQSGILFVPVPVTSPEEFVRLSVETNNILANMADEAEKSERGAT